MRLLLGFVLALLSAFTIFILVVTLVAGEGQYAGLIPMGVLVAMLAARPRPVLLDHKGIRQPRWFRGDREIAWADIAWIKRGWNSGSTYVRSRSGGRPITFSPLLVGQSRFEREVRAHSLESGNVQDE